MNENDLTPLSRRERAAGRRLAKALGERRGAARCEDRPGYGAQLLVTAFDGTAATRASLAYAVGLAGRERAFLQVIVSRSRWWGFVGDSPATRRDPTAGRTARLLAEVDALVDQPELKRRATVCSFANARTLEEYAESCGADAIVAPRPPCWRIGRWRAGWLIRHAKRPVIVIG